MVAAGLSLVAGGGIRASDILPERERLGEGSALPATYKGSTARRPEDGNAQLPLPTPETPTLSEVFAASARDGGATGFLLAQIKRGKPLLWVQERMAMLEAGRIIRRGWAYPS